MNHRQRDDLTRRQAQLLLRSAELRDTLAQQTCVLRSPLALVDTWRAGTRWLGRHPLWPLATLAWLILRPPRRLLRWLPHLLSAWQLWQQAGPWLARRAHKQA